MRSHAHLLEDPMIEISSFGTAAGGTPVRAYTLTAERAPVSVRVMDFGATILGITCPDAQGNVADIVTGDINGNYFNTPCFKGSATARDAVGGIITQVFAGEKTIDEAFSDAENTTLNQM